MDLTHAPFVHSGSFGAMAPDQLMPVEQWCRDDSVYERVIAPRDRHYRADQGRGLRAWFNQVDGKFEGRAQAHNQCSASVKARILTEMEHRQGTVQNVTGMSGFVIVAAKVAG